MLSLYLNSWADLWLESAMVLDLFRLHHHSLHYKKKKERKEREADLTVKINEVGRKIVRFSL